MESRTSPLSHIVKNTVSLPAGSLVIRLRDKIVNCYLISEQESSDWIVVDAGMSAGFSKRIFKSAEQWFGPESKPAAIILTHGHFDHVGALPGLLEHWNVPVYAHKAEMPFLTGRADYPPADPTVGGGLMARMSPLFSRKGSDLGDRVQVLPEDFSIPHIPSWRWIHTPGHTPGHISLFRDRDRTLVAGDAFVTVKNESALAVLTQRRHVCRPPAYLTMDWEQARRSVETLSELQPETAFTGHGQPMQGELLRHELADLAAEFSHYMPSDGRYVRHPAISDERGVQYIPPTVPDRLPKVVRVMGAAATIAAGLIIARKMRQRRMRKRLFRSRIR
jgi:glyoxylase-like metal-dependent hydrolase (beta-lactamase superfamily II)